MNADRPAIDALGSVDAVLMCGEGTASRPVLGENKIYLPVNGRPIFLYVLAALMLASRVRRIFVVGNKPRLEAAIGAGGQSCSKPVTVIAQGRNLLENVWRGFIATLDGYAEGAEKDNRDFAGRVILGLPGDSPLITPEEIDDFIGEADMTKFDYAVGLTPASSLARFQPSGGRPGIRMTSLHLREGLFRISNLHLARPFAFKDREAVLRIYETRYQRKLSNVLLFARHLWAEPGLRSRIWLYLALQACLALSRMGLAGSANILRRLIPADKLVGAISQITGARAGVVITTHGGGALDIDNESDYRAMTQMFDRWRAPQ
jgi:CTP:molybdopterin cytidylyltransferase MocA